MKKGECFARYAANDLRLAPSSTLLILGISVLQPTGIERRSWWPVCRAATISRLAACAIH